MSCEIHIGDIGTELKIQIQDCGTIVDISAASQLSIMLKKPNGNTLTKSASLVNDGTDGLMQYVVESGVLDQSGSWKIQALVVFNTSKWYTNYETFKVYRNIL